MGPLYPVNRRLYSKKIFFMGPYAGVDYILPYFIANSIVSQLSTHTTKGKGWMRKIFPICWAHLYLSANFKITNRKGESMERRREGLRADIMSLNSHFMEHGQPHAWSPFNLTLLLALTPIKWLCIQAQGVENRVLPPPPSKRQEGRKKLWIPIYNYSYRKFIYVSI